MLKIRILALLFGLLLLAAPAHARTLHVNAKSTPSGDGLSWASAFQDLAKALNQATSGDEIWVAAGTYRPGTTRHATFKLKSGVALYGGFAGNETERDDRDFKQHQAVLSGDIGTPGMPEDNVFHVVTGADDAVLDGFTITGGYSANAGWDTSAEITADSVVAGPKPGQGAGMLNFKAAPVVRNCVFQDNHALEGGAVYIMDAAAVASARRKEALFRDCAFWQNSAIIHGGGVANMLHTASMFINCVFDSNISDGIGGGMVNAFGSSPRLLNSIFRNNEAVRGGGMANVDGSSPTLFYCTLTGNQASEKGPALSQEEGPASTPVLLKTIVWDNGCQCDDIRFFNGHGSEVRVQDSVIQNGYKGKSVFQANPGLDRKSVTMLNVGYKTAAYRFRESKVSHRLKDIEHYGIDAHRPGPKPGFAMTIPPALLKTIETAAVPVTPIIQTAPAPAEPAPAAPTPEPETVVIAPVPTTAPTPTPKATPKSEPVKKPAPVAKAAPIKKTPAPAAKSPAPEPKPEPQKDVAVYAPLPSTQPLPKASGDGASSPEKLVKEMDFDRNGCLTINEVRGPLQKKFWRVDANGDGCLSAKEIAKAEGKKPQQKPTLQAAAPAAQKPVSTPRPSPAAPIQQKSAPKPVAQRTAPAPVAAKQPVASMAPAPATPKAAKPTAPGYTLFAPIGGTDAYLIDSKGTVVKQWPGRDRSSGAVYLLNNGNLLRSVSPKRGEVNTPFRGEGVEGGIIQEVSPRGQVVWEYSYVSDTVRQHHDIEPLPNGNVLLLAWEMKYKSDILAAGGSLRNHPDGRLWVEHIVEVRKTGPRTGYIVWEWHAWDHLVQNTNSDGPNYANPVRLPQRIDVNYNPTRLTDWQHANSIDYDPVSRQILLSLRNMNEIWAIDHTTTTTQAASNAGGVYHRGGDLLFRWGNPAAYSASAPATLAGQHDARWVPGRRPGEATITLFNNDSNRARKSDVLEIQPANYLKSTQVSAQVLWSYLQQGGTPFFADQYSGAQKLANGNMLVCDGPGARLFEVTPTGKTAWDYQFNESGSRIYKATRIPATHPGLRRLGIK